MPVPLPGNCTSVVEMAQAGNNRVLVVDNYDSFVFNLVQYIGELGAEPVVVRHDEITIDEAVTIEPACVLISPGPGRPEDAGISIDIILKFGSAGVPVLGVCLGHQCIGQVFGGKIVRAEKVMHGKTSLIRHDGKGVFGEVSNPFEATRYHSLIVERSSVPESLQISAETYDGVVMGLRHKELPIEGVQFHPESVLTRHGHQMIRNFLLMGGIAAKDVPDKEIAKAPSFREAQGERVY